MSRSLFSHVTEEVYAGARDKTAYLFRQGFRLTHIHEYTSSEGKPSWWVLRMEGDQIEAGTGKRLKRILPMRRTEIGFELKQPAFQWGHPLYNQHLIANYPDDLVYLVEGEKCADRMVQLGSIATTWPFGAASIEKVDFSLLAARRVVCWPDNDSSGIKAMERAGVALRNQGSLVVTLDVLALELPPKGDVVDWLVQFIDSQGAQDFCAIPEGHALAWNAIRSLPVVQPQWALVA